MILSQDSILHLLPSGINSKQIRILDSMRFSLEIIDYTYESLLKELIDISLHDKQKNLPKLMHYSWSLIDFTQRFYSLYKKLSKNTNNNIEVLNNWAFRNACQHFTSNLEKVLNDEKQPYGALKWVVKHDSNGEVFSCLAISGISAVFHDMKHTIINVSGKDYNSIINDIMLEIAVFDKVEKRKELNLSILMADLVIVVRKLEENLMIFSQAEGLIPTNWNKRKDILIKFKPEDPLKEL